VSGPPLSGGWLVELVRQLAQALGDNPIGAVMGLVKKALRLLLGVVDHARSGLLGGVHDSRKPLRRIGG